MAVVTEAVWHKVAATLLSISLGAAVAVHGAQQLCVCGANQ